MALVRPVIYGGENPWPSRERLRIAVVSPRAGPEILGGAENLLAQLAGLLRDLGHEVEILGTQARSYYTWRNELASRTTINGLPVRRFPVSPFDPDTFHLYYSRARVLWSQFKVDLSWDMYLHAAHSSGILQYLKSRHPDLDLILTGPAEFRLTLDQAIHFPHKCVVVPCLHDSWLARQEMIRRPLLQSRGLMFNTEEEMALAREVGIIHPRGAVVGYGLDPKRDRGRKPRDVTGRGRPYLLYAGQLYPNKNLGRLIEAFVAFKKLRPEVQLDLALAGSGAYEPPKREDIIPLGFIPRRTLLDAYANATALLNLSLYESFSIVLMESWLNGVPVIVSAECAVTRAHVERSGGGWVCLDVADVTRVLGEIVDRPREAAEKGRRGRDYVMREHTVDCVRERLRQALRCFAQDLQPAAPRQTGDLMRTSAATIVHRSVWSRVRPRGILRGCAASIVANPTVFHFLHQLYRLAKRLGFRPPKIIEESGG